MKDIFEKYKQQLKGKKLLIMGGASQHCKLVEAARELGVITYVTDNLVTNAPAKDFADFAYNINLLDTEELAALCEKEHIDGIASGWLDFPQIPYQKLCQRVGLHCYGTPEQFDILTRKAEFKKLCQSYGVGVPKAITQKDIDGFSENLPMPVFVKPSDSAGSKGSTVARTKTELLQAIEEAKKASNDGLVITEECIENAQAFLVVYFFHNGEAYVQQLANAYFGNKEDGLQKINVAYRTPFSMADKYMDIANDRFIAMLKGLGVKEGPVCMQGFMTDKDALFYDPGRRFPGGEYERIFKRYTGIDMMKGMVIFALTGSWPEEALPVGDKPYLMDGRTTIRLQINVGPGVVASDVGFDIAKELPFIEYVAQYHFPGDTIEATGNTHQRYAHVVIGANNTEELIKNVQTLYNTIDVFDNNGNSMIRSKLDEKLL